MPLNAAFPIVNILIAGRLKVSSAMAFNAKNVLSEVALFVKRCGTFFSCMPELAKNQNVMYPVASALMSPVSQPPGILQCIALHQIDIFLTYAGT